MFVVTYRPPHRLCLSDHHRVGVSSSINGGAGTLPRPHQPCHHARTMVSSLGPFLFTLVSQSAFATALWRQATEPLPDDPSDTAR